MLLELRPSQVQVSLLFDILAAAFVVTTVEEIMLMPAINYAAVTPFLIIF